MMTLNVFLACFSLLLLTPQNIPSRNLCRKDACCPGFSRPTQVHGWRQVSTEKKSEADQPCLGGVACCSFCASQEPIQSRKHWNIFQNQDSVGSQFLPLFTYQMMKSWSPVTAPTCFGKCHMIPHASWEPHLTIHLSLVWFPVRTILH